MRDEYNLINKEKLISQTQDNINEQNMNGITRENKELAKKINKYIKDC